MSKSIKDYKDVMDSIKISDSFYKRTEVLLSDLSEMEIEKKPIYGGRRITALVMTAAACLACVIGVKVMVDSRQSEISTVETGITEIIESEATESVTVNIIDDFDGGDDDSMLVDKEDMDALPTDGMENVGTAVNNDSDGGNISAGEPNENGNSPAPAGGGVGDRPDNGQTINTANPTAILPHKDGNENMSAEEGRKEGEASVPVEGYPEFSDNDGGAVNIPSLRDTAAEVITVEITPYFNMGSIKSGEGAVKMNGAECNDIIDYIAEISENSHEMGSYSFKSVFSIQISDENIGETYYSIYLTDLNALIINKHLAGGQQRATYGVKDEDYNSIMRRLFNIFGNDEDYELFNTLISGK